MLTRSFAGIRRWTRVLYQRPTFVVAYVAVWLAIGTAGYVVVEGWSAGDSLYMTVITLTAVGYQEVNHLTPSGRALTMFLLIGGLTSLGLVFALLTSLFVRLDLRDALRSRRMTRNLAKLSDHAIVCGAGRTGRQVVAELEAAQTPYAVVDIDEGRLKRLQEEHPDALVVLGDATHDDTLRETGVKRAAGLLSCLQDDADNLFVCLSARALASELVIVARADEEESVSKMKRAGADHVIIPTVSGAIQMASVMMRPSVVSFLDVATRAPHLALRLEQAAIMAESPLAGVTLSEAQIPQHTGLIVIALRKMAGDEDFVFNPVGSTILDPDDVMIVLGTGDQVQALKNFVTS